MIARTVVAGDLSVSTGIHTHTRARVGMPQQVQAVAGSSYIRRSTP